ncbi:hypothetical protein [Photobacterium damselae]|uniref:hypothetical protein n=1 Tax=Photobacterium damselae TaxID=38293 RepID=UPI0010FD1C99|nr:hypothetical protein [Photobacterium damselae]TLS77475.1 hypothetical protein FD721_11630 [Photobacterium damselae subsp. damselae]TLS89798.1 hypothetical protein FD720_01435 [Photobacterium damselae subsp. damselae]
MKKYKKNKSIGMVNLLKVSYKSFISILLSLFLTTLVQPLISYIANFSIAGQYAIYEKIMRAVLSLFDSIYKVFYTKALKNRNLKLWVKRIVLISSSFLLIAIVVIWIIIQLKITYKGIVINDHIQELFYIVLTVFFCSIGNGCLMTILYPNNKFNAVNLALTVSILLFLFSFFLVSYSVIEASVINFLIILMISEFISNFIKVIFSYFEVNKNEITNNN